MVNVLDKVQPKTKEQLKQLINYAFKHNIYDLNFIDTSNITDMSWLFRYNDYNFDVSSWNVSKVKNMYAMFGDCTNFNCDLSDWDVSNVKNMNAMFSGCKKFTGKGLENCDVSNVKDMSKMFNGCKFNYHELNWDLSGLSSQIKTFRNYLAD